MIKLVPYTRDRRGQFRPLVEIAASAALAIQDAVNEAIVQATSEARGLIRAHVASRLSGRAAGTVAMEVGPDVRPEAQGGSPGFVVGTVYSRWWRKHQGRVTIDGGGVKVRVNQKKVNVLDAWQEGPTVVTYARRQYHAIPTDAAGRRKGGGKMTVEEWVARHNRRLKVVPLGRVAGGRGRVQLALVADNVRRSVRTGEAKARTSRARLAKRQEVIFWLVKEIRFQRRLDTQPIKDRVDAAVPGLVHAAAERRGVIL